MYNLLILLAVIISSCGGPGTRLPGTSDTSKVYPFKIDQKVDVLNNYSLNTKPNKEDELYRPTQKDLTEVLNPEFFLGIRTPHQENIKALLNFMSQWIKGIDGSDGGKVRVFAENYKNKIVEFVKGDLGTIKNPIIWIKPPLIKNKLISLVFNIVLDNKETIFVNTKCEKTICKISLNHFGKGQILNGIVSKVMLKKGYSPQFLIRFSNKDYVLNKNSIKPVSPKYYLFIYDESPQHLFNYLNINIDSQYIGEGFCIGIEFLNEEKGQNFRCDSLVLAGLTGNFIENSVEIPEKTLIVKNKDYFPDWSDFSSYIEIKLDETPVKNWSLNFLKTNNEKEFSIYTLEKKVLKGTRYTKENPPDCFVSNQETQFIFKNIRCKNQ